MKLKIKILSVLLVGVVGFLAVFFGALVLIHQQLHVNIMLLKPLLGVLVICLLIITLLVIWGVHRFLKPLEKVVTDVQNIVEKKTTFKPFSVQTKDEVGKLATLLNILIGDAQADLSGILENTKSLQKHSSESIGMLEQNLGEIEAQLSNIDQIATASTEMSATAADVAQNAELTASSTQVSAKSCEEGQKVIEQNLESISKLETQITTAGTVIESLEENAESISAILATIQGIAEQTNLLALNAAIEAARAGESGRGFAVVADEVRNLAKRTQDATVEIHNMIEVLQENSHEAVEAMMESAVQSEDSVLYAQEARKQLENITKSIADISQMTEQIASAAEQQHAVAEDISAHTEGVRDLSSTLAVNVKMRVDQFKDMSQLIDDTNSVVKGIIL